MLSKSAILSRKTGDATLVLNNNNLLNSNYLFNRVITSLIQFVTVSPYPPKTSSLNRLFKDVSHEYSKYILMEKTKNAASKILFTSSEKNLTKRIELVQHTLSGASVYALSKNDTERRLSNFHKRSGKELIAGPALLIQREMPSKVNFKLLNDTIHDFSQLQAYLWDNRIFIQVKVVSNTNCSNYPLMFRIKPLSPILVRKFESMTKSDFSARKNLYSYLGMTPGSHLYTIPVLEHLETGYMAIPTLNCYSNRDLFEWKVFNASVSVYMSKFMCLP